MNTYQEMYDQGKKAKTVKDIKVDYVKWTKPGESILGRFINSSPVASSAGGGDYNQYLFDTDSGIKKFALGRSGDSEIGAIMVKDRVYKVTYQGKEKLTGTRVVNLFDCEEIGLGDEIIDTDDKANKASAVE